MDIHVGDNVYKGTLPRFSVRYRLLDALAHDFSSLDRLTPDDVAILAAFVGACWDHRHTRAVIPQPAMNIQTLAQCGNKVTVYGDQVFDRLMEIGHTEKDIIEAGMLLTKAVGDSVKRAQAKPEAPEEAGEEAAGPFASPAGA